MFQQSLSKCTASIKTNLILCPGFDDYDYYVVQLREILQSKPDLFSSLKKCSILACPRPPAHFIKKEDNPLDFSFLLPPSRINQRY